MKINITNTKIAIAFAIGLILTQISCFFEKIPWLFVASVLIGIIIIVITMAYFVYHFVHFMYNKMNEK